MPGDYYFDVTTLKMGNRTVFSGGDLEKAFSTDAVFVYDALHEQTDNQSKVFTTALVFQPTTSGAYDTYRIIFSIDGATRERTLVAKGKMAGRVNLGLCRFINNRYIYQDAQFREGFVSSLEMTDNYFIIPVSSYIINPCFLLPQLQRMPRPKLSTWYYFDTTTNSKLLVVARKNGEFLPAYTLSAGNRFLSLHQINAYEDPDYSNRLHIDLLVYRTPNVFANAFTLNRLISNDPWPMEASAMRFTIDRDGPIQEPISSYIIMQPTDLVGRRQVQMPAEFPVINDNFHGKEYRFIYLLLNPYDDGGKVVKFDTRTGRQTAVYACGKDIYPGEPMFVPKPNGEEEDDGVLIVPAFDSDTKEGILYIVDAKNMKEIGQATSKTMTGFGLHNRFYSSVELGLESSATVAYCRTILCFGVVSMFTLIVSM